MDCSEEVCSYLQKSECIILDLVCFFNAKLTYTTFKIFLEKEKLVEFDKPSWSFVIWFHHTGFPYTPLRDIESPFLKKWVTDL